MPTSPRSGAPTGAAEVVDAGDQRDLLKVLGDVRGQVAKLNQDLEQFRLFPPRDDATSAHLNGVTVELREAVRFLSDRLDGVTRVVAQRAEEQAETRVALRQINDQLAGLGSAADGAVNDGLTRLTERVAATESTVLTGVYGVAATLEPISESVATLSADLARLLDEPDGGAALEARLTAHVDRSLRATERRLLDHIDDAVLALAETLLGMRSPEEEVESVPGVAAVVVGDDEPGPALPMSKPALLLPADDKDAEADDEAADEAVDDGEAVVAVGPTVDPSPAEEASALVDLPDNDPPAALHPSEFTDLAGDSPTSPDTAVAADPNEDAAIDQNPAKESASELAPHSDDLTSGLLIDYSDVADPDDGSALHEPQWWDTEAKPSAAPSSPFVDDDDLEDPAASPPTGHVLPERSAFVRGWRKGRHR